MGQIASIVVPQPTALQPSAEGQVTTGQGYNAVFPSLVTDAMRVTNSEGQTFTWRPTEMAYRDAVGVMDYIVGSSPVSVSVRGRTAKYVRPFPQADDVFVAEAEQIKHYTAMNEPPRSPAEYLGAGIEFGISGSIGGVPLPPGRHETIEEWGFRFPRPVARDLEGQEVFGSYEVVDSDEGQQLFIWFPADWFLNEDTVYPVMVDPTVGTTMSSAATHNPHQHKIDRFNSNGVLFVAFFGTDINFLTSIRYSADGGQTWLTPATGGTLNYGSTSTVPGTVRIDEDDYIHLVFKYQSGATPDDLIGYVRGTPNAARTEYTWSSVTALVSTPDFTGYPDVDVHREGTGWEAHIVYHVSEGGYSYVFYRRLTITSGGVVSITGSATLYSIGTSVATYPSIRVEANKNLHVTWTTNTAASGWGIRYFRATYSAGVWTWAGSAEEVTASYYAISVYMGPIAVDSLGQVYVTFNDQTTDYNYLRVFKRSTGGVWSEISPTPLTSFQYIGSQVVDGDDNLYIFYLKAGLNYRKYDGANWAAAVAIAGYSTAVYPSARRDTAGSAIDLVVTTGSASPYNVESYRLPLNAPPTAPTLTTKANFDATGAATFAWTFNDPDPGDGQSAYQLLIIRTSDSATLVNSGKVASAASTYELIAATLANNVAHQFKVKTWDSADAEGPYSELSPFHTSAKPTVTITVPVSNGTTVTSSSLTAEWSTSDPESEGQGSYQVRLTNNSDVELWDSGKVASMSGRSKTIGYTLAHGTGYKLKVIVWDAKDVPSAEAVRTFSVAYTPPAVPVLATVADSVNAANILTATNPTPGVGEPTVTSVRFERSTDAGVTYTALSTESVTNSVATWTDYAAAAETVYHYRAVAIGGGVETNGAWGVEYLRFDHWRFIPTAGTDPLTFAYNSQLQWRPNMDVQVPAIKGRYRRQYLGPTFAQTAELTALFAAMDDLTAREWRERLLDHVQDGTIGYLKSPMGDVWKGVLQSPSGEPDPRTLWESVRLTFLETGGSP